MADDAHLLHHQVRVTDTNLTGSWSLEVDAGRGEGPLQIVTLYSWIHE
ncbi:MAG TPA: hypothetical protein VN799_05465 [Acidimicrobiales bacterium]|nr:hypothetical protein [Acidimicrobiales bacterium]